MGFGVLGNVPKFELEIGMSKHHIPFRIGIDLDLISETKIKLPIKQSIKLQTGKDRSAYASRIRQMKTVPNQMAVCISNITQMIFKIFKLWEGL